MRPCRWRQAKRLLGRSPEMTAEEAMAEEADALDAIMET